MTRFGAIFGIAAVLLYPLVMSAPVVMEYIFQRVDDPRYGSLIASVFLFMVPTIILGMISPYSVRLLVENVEESGKVAGMLYFTSTLGSSIGTLMTSFYLVLWFEINTIIAALASILVVASLMAIYASKNVAGTTASR